MKTVTISAPAGANVITGGKFLETESGAVIEWDGTGTIVGFSESGVNDTTTPLDQGGTNVGCLKLGLINVEAAAATYNFGDSIEALDADTVQGRCIRRKVEGLPQRRLTLKFFSFFFKPTHKVKYHGKNRSKTTQWISEPVRHDDGRSNHQERRMVHSRRRRL